MPLSSKEPSELHDALLTAGRQLSTATVLLHHAIAERVGLSAADHKYLDILVQEGPMSAGQLAELAGLTTGAVTGVIDRLEEAGLVRREKDPTDRRKVIVQPLIDEAMRKLSPTFEGMSRSMERLYEGYSVEELTIILGYMERATAFTRELIRTLRKGGFQDSR